MISMQLAGLGRQRQELAGPGADGLEDQGAVAARAGRQHDGVRDALATRLAISSTAWRRIGVEGDQAKVGSDLGDPARRDLGRS